MANKLKTVVMLALPGVQLLDVSGPLDVFAEANSQLGQRAYELLVATEKPGPLSSSSGVRIMPDWVITEVMPGKIDTLLVAGCPKAPEMRVSGDTIDWLKNRTSGARRFGSVCSGAFFLAASGLLAGRRVTTHWAVADELARRYPDVIVEQDAIHITDGRLRTAAGVTAGLDLALALVEEDFGVEIAGRVASQLVMFFKRPGGQMQFSRKGEAVPTGRAALQELQRWVAANPGIHHDIDSMAQRLELSPRHFARLFRNEVGITPATWVEEARVGAARRLLEQDNLPPKQVATLCGFQDVDTFRRAFGRRVGVTPAEYRKRFSATSSS
jgi:transcriptional regulator GlxA family with amidase domain